LVQVYQLQKIWSELVGSPLASRAYPKKIERQILWVSVENPGWAQHLSLMREELLKVISKRMGYNFKDVRFLNEELPKNRFSKQETDEQEMHLEPSEQWIGIGEAKPQDVDLQTLIGRVRWKAEKLKQNQKDKRR